MQTTWLYDLQKIRIIFEKILHVNGEPSVLYVSTLFVNQAFVKLPRLRDALLSLPVIIMINAMVSVSIFVNYEIE